MKDELKRKLVLKRKVSARPAKLAPLTAEAAAAAKIQALYRGFELRRKGVSSRRFKLATGASTGLHRQETRAKLRVLKAKLKKGHKAAGKKFKVTSMGTTFSRT